MRLFIATALVTALFLPVCWAEDQTPADLKYRDSYSMGYEFVDGLKRQEIEVDKEALLSAVRDALEGRQSAVSADEIKEALKRVRRTAMIIQDRRARETAARNLEEGKAFLAANGAKEDVVTLSSGLQYKVISEGNGSSPTTADLVKVNYRGALLNGTEFDRSDALVIQIKGMIRAWQEALPLMKEGSKWQLYVPAELAYGSRTNGRIPANSVLVFDLELLSIEKDFISKAIAPAADALEVAGDLSSRLQVQAETTPQKQQ